MQILPRTTLPVWAWGTIACAPLNLADLPDPCRKAYSSCLNGCANTRATPMRSESRTIQRPDLYDGRRADWELQTDVASCTDACNDKAKTCAAANNAEP